MPRNTSRKTSWALFVICFFLPCFITAMEENNDSSLENNGLLKVQINQLGRQITNLQKANNKRSAIEGILFSMQSIVSSFCSSKTPTNINSSSENNSIKNVSHSQDSSWGKYALWFAIGSACTALSIGGIKMIINRFRRQKTPDEEPSEKESLKTALLNNKSISSGPKNQLNNESTKPQPTITPKIVSTPKSEKKIPSSTQIPEKLQKKNALPEQTQQKGLKKLLTKNKQPKTATPNDTRPIIQKKPQKNIINKPLKSPAQKITHKTEKVIPKTPAVMNKAKSIKSSGQLEKKSVEHSRITKPAAFTLVSLVVIAVGILWNLWKKKPIEDSSTAPTFATLRSAMENGSIPFDTAKKPTHGRHTSSAHPPISAKRIPKGPQAE